MATFDQRGQKVTYQYNAAGNINFGAVIDSKDISLELKKLLTELNKIMETGSIDGEVGVEAEAKVKKAIIQSEKHKPDKQSILDNLLGAKTLIDGVASAAGLVSGFVQAADMVRRLL